MVQISLVDICYVRFLYVIRFRSLDTTDDGEHFFRELRVVDVALAIEETRLGWVRLVRIQITQLVIRLDRGRTARLLVHLKQINILLHFWIFL